MVLPPCSMFTRPTNPVDALGLWVGNYYAPFRMKVNYRFLLFCKLQTEGSRSISPSLHCFGSILITLAPSLIANRSKP